MTTKVLRLALADPANQPQIKPPARCTGCSGTGRIQIHFRTKRKSYWTDCVVCEGLGWVRMPWLTLDGIGHILEMRKSGWNYTVCGIYTPNGSVTMGHARRCRKCRAMVKAHGRLPNPAEETL
jgi:hypothetical protein